LTPSTSEESCLQDKKCWSIRDQKLWDETKIKSNEELLNTIQEYWNDLSGDNEFYFPIQLLRQRLGVKLDEEYFGNIRQSYIDDGYPENEVTERKL